LSTKSELGAKKPLKAATYTGIAYILTVLFLVSPFFAMNNVFASLITTVIFATIVIALFTYYISIAKDMNFKRRFGEMVTISLGVAAISFLIGFVVKIFLGVGA
ncbi:MAG: VIT1/CCC1 transporter family protein, partial [Candidatus Aenigmatarchaeota archaeon]